MHGGDRVAHVLQAHGVRFVFTLCGGHISPILTAAHSVGIRVVDTRHEATAVFAADAVSRLTGVPGVAVVTAGPGLTNTITAVKNAQLAQSAIVVIGGATATVLKGRGALQDIDQAALMNPHVKEVIRVSSVRALEPELIRAFAKARRGVPGPVFVEMPVDLLYPEPVVREWYGLGGRTATLAGWFQHLYLERHLKRLFAEAESIRTRAPAAVPDRSVNPSVARRVASRIRSANRPLLIVGSQAVCESANTRVIAAAIEQLGIPVFLSGMARGLLGTNSAVQLRHGRRSALKSADLVLLAGVPCDFRLDYGRAIRRRTRLVSVNRSRKDLKLNRRPSISVHADPGSFLIELSRACASGEPVWHDWRAQLEASERGREQKIEQQSAMRGEHVNPVRLCREVNEAMSEDSIVVADGGDFVGTASYIVRPRSPLSWLDPGVFGTLGVGAGFALGAALARPDKQVWILFGDGSVGYSLAEFDTFVRHKISLIAIVGNDACWSQIAREQIKLLKDDTAVMLGRTEYQRVVAGFGASGLAIHSDGETSEVIRRAKAIAADGNAVLVNAFLDRSDFREGSISI